MSPSNADESVGEALGEDPLQFVESEEGGLLAAFDLLHPTAASVMLPLDRLPDANDERDELGAFVDAEFAGSEITIFAPGHAAPLDPSVDMWIAAYTTNG